MATTTTTFAKVYGAWTAFNLTAASLATSATLVAGQQSDVLPTVTLDDLQVAGTIFTGTSPTVNMLIQLFAWGKLDATTFPDQMGASDAARSVTSANVKGGVWLKPIMGQVVDAANNVGYPFSCWSLKNLFGGELPEVVGLWLTHSTVAALKSASHVFKYRTVTYTATTA